MIVYHGTSLYLASKILAAGYFRAVGKGVYNKRGAVFFTDHQRTAEEYAIQKGRPTINDPSESDGVVFVVDVPRKWLRRDGGALRSDGWFQIFHTARDVPAEMIVRYYEVKKA